MNREEHAPSGSAPTEGEVRSERGGRTRAEAMWFARFAATKERRARRLLGFGAVANGVGGALSELRRRSFNNWQLKVAAFLLAVVFWFFVSMDETVISQRTVRAPLKVEGLVSNQLTSGVPDTVEVRLSGPAHRISTLSPSGIDAVLDLRGASGSFEQAVRVFPPQGISLLGVQPSEVVGSVESQVSQAVPVEAALIGGVPDDFQIEVHTLPSAVVVSGPESQVIRVARVLAPIGLDQPGETVPIYPVDEAGLPVPEVSVQPEQVAVTLSEVPVLHTRRVPVVLRPLAAGRWRVVSATLSQPEALLAGQEADLAGLERVRATAALGGPDMTPGVHPFELSLELPEGVTALEVPQLEVELAALEEPEPQTGKSGTALAGEPVSESAVEPEESAP